MNRLYADLKQDHKGFITGAVKLPADGTFTFEAILMIVSVFSESVSLSSEEVLTDLLAFSRSQGASSVH